MDGNAPAPPALLAESVTSSETRRHLVTGNRLRDGVPVYFVGAGHWSPDINAARHVGPEAADALLAEAQAAPMPHPAVGVYLIEAAFIRGLPRPLTLRERIRAFGPTTAVGKR